MKVLITAGSTNVMIDQVRCISNIFKGRTGSELARYFFYNVPGSWSIDLITSNHKYFGSDDIVRGINILPYKTYDELYSLMEKQITSNDYDIIIHSAAVSDYKVEGTYYYDYDSKDEKGFACLPGMSKVDSSKKISSSSKELYLKLVPTEKIIDKIRNPWGFKGKLIKFKLQVGITDQELIDIAYKSMLASKADFIVANCLEWSQERAFILNTGPYNNMEVKETKRSTLPCVLFKSLGIL